MKRLLAVIALLSTLLVPGLAQAEQFLSGAFDDNLGLFVNLSNNGFDTSGLTRITNRNTIDMDAKYTFASLGYSAMAKAAALRIGTVNSELGTVDNNFDIAGEYSISELVFQYTDYIQNKSISESFTTLLLDEIYVKEIYKAEQEVVFLGVTYVPGTMFVSFTIPNTPGKINSIDFVLAISPSAVPVPAAMWLLGSGLAGLVTLRRKLR